jgi:hypothetical protein
MCTGRYQHQSFWNKGLISPTDEVSGFLPYQLHVEVIVLYFWSCFGFIEVWIMICYIVLIALEGDTSCTIWRGHCARETAVLVVVWCYKARGDKEHDLWRYWLPEDCIKQWYDKPEYMVASARSVSWGRIEAVSLLYLVPWPSTRTYRVKTHDSKHSCFTPLTRIFMHTADNSLLPFTGSQVCEHFVRLSCY